MLLSFRLELKFSHDEVDYPSWRSGLDGEEDDLDEMEEDEEDL